MTARQEHNSIGNIQLRLYTIAYRCRHEGEATLQGIFATEDAINRSAPTYEELQVELGALLSANLITETESGYKTTDTGNLLYEQVNSIEGNVFSRLDALSELLCDHLLASTTIMRHDIDKVDFDEAYKSYYRGT